MTFLRPWLRCTGIFVSIDLSEGLAVGEAGTSEGAGLELASEFSVPDCGELAL